MAGASRAERLWEMEKLYLVKSYSDMEMGERLGVNRSTAYKDRILLMNEVPIVQDSDNRWRIDRSRYISSIRVDLREALSLYLATRRASQQGRAAQRSTASALEKLATTLRQPMTERLVQAADRILARTSNPEQEKIFETTAQAWVEGLCLRLRYRGLRSSTAYADLFAVYLIEPSPWSDSVYLIGRSDHWNDIAVYKLDRIERASLSGEPANVPEDFDEQELLRYAWGIWRSEKPPEPVQLRFAPGVATRRVKESVWHPLEKVTDTDDGGCLWEAPIAEWQEMLPWIRGWGADCEVLGPVGLVDKLRQDSQRMLALYGNGIQTESPLYQRIWAKTSRDRKQTHPLICHLLDVAQVTAALWQVALPIGLRNGLARTLGVDDESACRTIAFWAGLHDLGKASPGFQRKYAPAEDELSKAGLTFAPLFAREPCYHATITTCTLAALLQEETVVPPALAREVAQALGGHHGAWPTSRAVRDTKLDQIGGDEWQTVRRRLVQTLRDVLQPAPIASWTEDRIEANGFLALFSGLVSVADWIGSIETAFPFAQIPLDPDNYAELATNRANRILRELRWDLPIAFSSDLSFTDLFPFPPNDLQQAVIGLTEQLDEPSLVIIEAPTGQGKTEAAQYLAAYWYERLQQRGLYVAMPTMATSNQMHERTRHFLQSAGITDVAPLLIHSQARWQEDAPPPRVQTEEENPNGQQISVDDMRWFLPRKRSLLAPFGVGTVDQALLSVLQTRHFFVRLFALGHKTVIFDEVHAYDTYMSHLFQRLLRWLRATNTSVVLLSATLPASTRNALLYAYLDNENIDLPPASYPAITWASGGRLGSTPLPQSTERTIELKWVQREPAAIVAKVRSLLRNGGCAAIICNTVARAQEIFGALQVERVVDEDELVLFHARTPFAWRNKTEQQVLARFGKNGERPQRAIVVATQVIEQSLDLDFDVIVTDLPPVDLLLQRAGRLQRHRREERPVDFTSPTVYIAVSADEESSPGFGSDKYVYESYVLLRSYLALKDRTQIAVPDDTAGLIEEVYGDEAEQSIPGGFAPILAKARAKMERKQSDARVQATQRLVAAPGDRRLLRNGSADLREENPDVHDALRALTRLGPPSISLVCLHSVEDALNTEPDGSGVWIDPDQMPDNNCTRALSQHTVNVSHQRVVRHLLGTQHRPAAWREHALLSNHFLVVFEGGVASLEGAPFRLYLDRTLGLIIEATTRDEEE